MSLTTSQMITVTKTGLETKIARQRINPPISIYDSDSTVNQIDSDSTPGTATGVTILAVDPAGSTLTGYSLSGTYGGQFDITSSGQIIAGSGALVAGYYDVEAIATFADGTTASKTTSIEVVEVETVNYGDYEKTDETAGTANLIVDSEPDTGELWATTGSTITTSGLGGFFDRAWSMVDSSTLRLVYMRLPDDPQPGETYRLTVFLKKTSDGTQPVISASTNVGDLSLVVDNAPRAADSIVDVGAGWFRASVEVTFGDPVAGLNFGVIKYTDQSDEEILVTGFDVRLTTPATPNDVLTNWAPLSSGEQTYRALYDSRYTSYASAEAAVLTSPYPEIRSYTGQYWIYASTLMYLATGDSAYIEKALSQSEDVLTACTIEDDAGYLNFGASSTGAGVTTYTANGTNSPAGTVTAYLLYEIQGMSMIATVCAIILSRSDLSSLHARAETVRDFVALNIFDKWDSRGAVENTLNYLNPSYSGGGQDQALHIGVTAYALFRAGATTTVGGTYEAWGTQTINNIIGRMTDSQAVSPNTPISGARYMQVPGLFDTSHNNRYPYGALLFWLLGHPNASKALLENMGKHFSSMLWNQDTDAPGFSSDYRGGSPFNNSALSAIYLGFNAGAAASSEAGTVMAHVAAKIASGGSITGNTYQAGVLANLAAEMAGRAIRGSMS